MNYLETREAFDALSKQQKIEALTRELLFVIGENPEREGLSDTPRRVAKWWAEFTEYDAGKTETTFESIHTDQMVVVTGMRVWSLCEHHMLPFYCDISVAYIAQDKIIGLSKLARIAHKYAHKLQVQERLVTEIADDLQRVLKTDSVAVIGSGVHLCMVMRGIKTNGMMTSSVMRGSFKEESTTRAEFLSFHNNAIGHNKIS